MSSPRTRTVLGLLGATVAATAMSVSVPALAHDGVDQGTGTGPGASPGPVAARGIAAARAATARFHTPAVALAAGYLPTDTCVPGMGQHWVSPAAMADGVADPSRPDILLYAPRGTGGRLLGAEWFAVDADQDLTTDADRPSMAGMAFDGPMPGHEPGMPVHYDLHLYLWDHNPAGIAAPSNPDVTC